MPYQQSAPRKQRSGCLKIFVITAIICTLLGVACCVFAGWYVTNSTVTDPGQLATMSDELIEWDFNDEIPPVFGIDVYFFKMVVQSDPSNGMIMVIQLRLADLGVGTPISIDEGSAVDFSAKDEREETELVEDGDKNIIVGDETVVLDFNKTRGRQSGIVYWEIAGVVPGKAMPVLVFMQLNESRYSEALIEQRVRGLAWQ